MKKGNILHTDPLYTLEDLNILYAARVHALEQSNILHTRTHTHTHTHTHTRTHTHAHTQHTYHMKILTNKNRASTQSQHRAATEVSYLK